MLQSVHFLFPSIFLFLDKFCIILDTYYSNYERTSVPLKEHKKVN